MEFEAALPRAVIGVITAIIAVLGGAPWWAAILAALVGAFVVPYVFSGLFLLFFWSGN